MPSKFPNSHLGPIIGAWHTTARLTSLFGVLGEPIGIVPVLEIAAAVTFLSRLLILVGCQKNRRGVSLRNSTQAPTLISAMAENSVHP